MGVFSAICATIEFLTADDKDKAKKWCKDHPALTLEEECIRNDFIYGTYFGKYMNDYTLEQDRAYAVFFRECKLINERYPSASDEQLRVLKVDHFMYMKNNVIGCFEIITHERMLRIIDDTSRSRTTAEAEEREKNHFTIEKARQYYKEWYSKVMPY